MMQAALLSLTFDDILITTSTLSPLFDAVKDAFWTALPYLIAIYGIKLAIWVLPVLFKHLIKR